MTDYRNRITALEYVNSRDLTPHPGNWRNHGKAQTEALRGVLSEVGIAGALLAYHSERNGGKLTVIDGHLRKDAAPQTWPVLVLDVDDAEADYLLATHDPLAAMATADAAAVDALLSSVNSGDQAVQEMLAGLAQESELLDSARDWKASRGGRLYSGHEIEPFKLAHRVEAAWDGDGELAIDLFSGAGQCASWYRRRFKKVVTVDKNFSVGDVDFSMSAIDFVQRNLNDFIEFDFIDFDDEGCPVDELAAFFASIEGKQRKSFRLALTDGNGLNMKLHGYFDFAKYLIPDEKLRRSTKADYLDFDITVSNFIAKIAARHGFDARQMSNWRGRDGNVVYQTYRISCAAKSSAGCDTRAGGSIANPS